MIALCRSTLLNELLHLCCDKTGKHYGGRTPRLLVGGCRVCVAVVLNACMSAASIFEAEIGPAPSPEWVDIWSEGWIHLPIQAWLVTCVLHAFIRSIDLGSGRSELVSESAVNPWEVLTLPPTCMSNETVFFFGGTGVDWEAG